MSDAASDVYRRELKERKPAKLKPVRLKVSFEYEPSDWPNYYHALLRELISAWREGRLRVERIEPGRGKRR